jgi:FAD:protein FMN transferase
MNMSWHVFRHEAMATYFEISVAGQQESYAQQASAAAFRELDRLESELSRYVESSDVSRANRLGRGESVRLGADAFECLLLAADASIATGRAFDPSYASIGREALGPDALPFTLDPDGHTLTSHVTQLHLDLGAIGKGFALDCMAETLREWQVKAACLNSGGSTALALAAPAGKAGWPIGVGNEAHPLTLHLTDTALSGSGTAVKGEHIADPRTGATPLRTTRAWALAKSAAVADALSTAFFVMDEREIAAFCLRHPEISAATTARDGRLNAYGLLTAKVAQANARS